MEVIPVIDIRYGVVVRAVAGDRANYQPIVSPLFDGCDPCAAVAGLMALHRFPVIYVADLDGIEGRGANWAVLRALGVAHPGVGFWVDSGARAVGDVAQLLDVPGAVGVIGSETGIGKAELEAIRADFAGRVVISLDFRSGVSGPPPLAPPRKGEGNIVEFVGRPEVLEHAASWPERVIAMTLGRVGTNRGPDRAVLADIVARSAGRQVFAAGGVRDGDDLRALAGMGIAGALVSSALHARTITADDLGERPPAD